MRLQVIPTSCLLVLVACAEPGLDTAATRADAGRPEACLDGEGTDGRRFFDGDGDGHGDPERPLLELHAAGDWVSSCGDCDDADPDVHPDAPEVCDERDNDCDGEVDELELTGDTAEGTRDSGLGGDGPAGLWSTWFRDADGDGYGDPGVPAYACSAPSGYVADGSDCSDVDASVHPGGTEACNGRDDDCDGLVDDEDPDVGTWYRDADWDGHGDPESAVVACEAPAGHVAEGDDCDDADPDVHPGAPEVDAGVDNDCDGEVDNTLPVAVAALGSTGADAEPTRCGSVGLSPAGSYDPDGDLIVDWEWSVQELPSDGVEEALEVDEVTGIATHRPDAAGAWRFGLRVSDGEDWSSWTRLDVEVVDLVDNGAPVAAAGDDVLVSMESACTERSYGYDCGTCTAPDYHLDGSATSDPEDHALTWSWSSKSAQVTLSDADTSAPTLAFDALGAELDSVNTVVIEVILEVEDCPGATSQDTVEITLTCTGT